MLAWVSSSLIVLFLAGVFNLAVDPGHLNPFATPQHIKIEAAMAQGMSVLYPGDFDERGLIASRLANPIFTPETIILGSSRALYLRCADLGLDAHSCYNAGLGGGKLSDFEKIIKVDLQKQRGVSRIVWVIDEWNFYPLPDEHRSAQVSQRSSPIAVIGAVLSLTYLRLSFSSLLTPSNVPTKISPQEFDTIAVHTKFADGSVEFPKAVTGRSTKEVDAAIASTVGTNRYILNSQNGEWSGSAIASFLETIDRLKERGIQVSVVFTPHHPIAHSHLNSSHRLDELEGHLRRILGIRKVTVVGSYNPSKLAFNSGCFFDEHHIRPDMAPCARGKSGF